MKTPKRCKGSSKRWLWGCWAIVLNEVGTLSCPKPSRAPTASASRIEATRAPRGTAGFARIMWGEQGLAMQRSHRLKQCFIKHYYKKQMTSQIMWPCAENKQAAPTAPILLFHLYRSFSENGAMSVVAHHCEALLHRTASTGENALATIYLLGTWQFFQGWGSGWC